MLILTSLFCVIFSLFTPAFVTVLADGDYVQTKGCCIFKGPDFKDNEYILDFHFNNNLMMEFNSTRGNWTGFTPFAINTAKFWNSDPYDRLQRNFEKKTLCTDNIDYIKTMRGDVAVSPTVKLSSVKHGDATMLVCSVYDFYPKQIKVTWLRNGQEVTSVVSTTGVIPDGDWSYQIHSYLQYTPTSGEIITCMVEHFSLPKPIFQVWDPSLPVTECIKIVVGLCGLMLGFVALSAGLIHYKKKSAAYITFCQEQVLVPVEDIPAALVT